MTIFAAHKILVSSAIGLGGILLLYGVWQYAQRGDGGALATGIASAAIGGALGFYLRWFVRKRLRR